MDSKISTKTKDDEMIHTIFVSYTRFLYEIEDFFKYKLLDIQKQSDLTDRALSFNKIFFLSKLAFFNEIIYIY